MVVDLLKNIEYYKYLSEDIYVGLKFLSEVSSDIEVGEYQIADNVKALVMEYETKYLFENGYEAHKRAIDIQYPILGVERIKWSPIAEMDINIPYDDTKDIIFYKSPSEQGMNVDIGNGVFAIMFPEDGHSPQYCIDKPIKIKKITIKISI